MAFIQNVFGNFIIVACCLLLSCVGATAQTPAPSPQQNGAQPTTPTAVNLNVIFTDEAGRSANDVRREDVRVSENGVQQTINSFAQEERPASYGLLIDTSGSMREMLDEVIATAHAVVKGNRAGDETFIMHYVSSDMIEVDEGWTGNQAALAESLDDLFVQGGLTATLDALHRGLTFVKTSHAGEDKLPRRSALVIITDGEDRGSRQSNPEILLARLREMDVQVFVIGLTKLGKEVRNREKAASLLNRIAQESGGRAFFPKTLAELPDAVKELTHDLHTQYVVSYNPTNAARDGSFRKIQVTLAPGKSKRAAITRAGYAAPR